MFRQERSGEALDGQGAAQLAWQVGRCVNGRGNTRSGMDGRIGVIQIGEARCDEHRSTASR